MSLAETLSAAQLSPLELGRIVDSIARQPGRWRDIVRFDAGQRWYQRLELTDDLEVWLLSWLPGQGTGFHDHGEAVGAFTVAQGELAERIVPARQTEPRARPFAAGQVRPFGPAHVHDVVNVSSGPAVSVHAYSPPLTAMRRYELTGSGLVHTGTERAELGW
ncbi:MAG: cysteine dioxygenase family protein [Actinomycetota bacterium]